MEQKQIRLMVIGLGPHAKRIYLPLIEKFQKKYNLSLELVVDLKEKEEEVKNTIRNYHTYSPEFFGVRKTEGEFELNEFEYKELEKLKIKRKINSVIIASKPTTHKTYAKWALNLGLHILMDKPISARINSSIKVEEATKIYLDYEELKKLYLEKEKENTDIIFSCLSQRRYHPAIKTIKRNLDEVFSLTKCPVTAIIFQHSDGQWRMPNEILSEEYHGFNEGYGKCSHSGYHFFDIASWYTKGIVEYDKIENFTNFIRPEDFFEQIKIEQYKKLFGKTEVLNEKLEDIKKKISNFGELDAHINYCLKKENNKITNIMFSLLHNGFSKRSWFISKKDLYKGNGRVRHETHIIHQGPFQTIYYVSYQSDEIYNENLSGLGEIGGELHSDVYIFRNSKMLGGNLPNFEIIHFGKRNENGLKNYSRGHQEDARGECFCEFIEGINKNIPKNMMKSIITDHEVGVTLMTLAYLSAAKEKNNSIPISFAEKKGEKYAFT